MKVGTPLIEFAESAEQDAGTIVGELDTGAHPSAAEIPSAPLTGQEPQAFPAVRAWLNRVVDQPGHVPMDWHPAAEAAE